MGSRKKQEDKHLQILRELVTQQNNKKCFDCGQRGPTYVNMTIGAFVCTSCSGLLRGLNPPHRIKSISMATFNAQEIEFLQNHGNEVCYSTWLALWESPLAPEPESRDEQKVKDFLARKYERKMWYSSRPKSKPVSQQEPEARPLKTLLGENAPKVVVAAQQEQKSSRISPPHISMTAIQKSVQPAAPQQAISNMDLLGDLGSDPFGTAAPPVQNNQDAFGMFQQPPPAQNQQFFNDFNSTQPASQLPNSTSFDSFVNSGIQQPPSSVNLFASGGGTTVSSPFSNSSTGAIGIPSAGDKYAAFNDLDLFKSSTTQSVFSGSSVFSSSPNISSGLSSNTQPNPFMSPGTQSSGAAVFQQQQQQAVNPFQSMSQPTSSGNPFPQQQINHTQQMNAFSMQNQPQCNSWGVSSGSMNNSNQFQAANVSGLVNNVSSNQQNLSFAGAGLTAMTANQFHMQPQSQFSQVSSQSNVFSQSNFPSQQQSGFNSQTGFLQQKSGFNSQTGFPSQQQSGFNSQTGFPSQQQSSFNSQAGFPPHQGGYGGQQFNAQPQGFNAQQNFNQQQFGMQSNFNTQQNQSNFPGGFGKQQNSELTKYPFGGVQMPGLQPQQQQQQSFALWGQTTHQQPSRSTNPFM